MTAEREDATAQATAETIKRLSGRDRVGSAGEIMAAAGGAAAGAVAAAPLAAAAGASTLAGSTTLAGLLGGIFVTATPVGWVFGTIAFCAAAGYSIAQLVRSGGRNDRLREEIIARLSTGISSQARPDVGGHNSASLEHAIKQAVDLGRMSEANGQRLTGLVRDGKLDVSVALARVGALLPRG